MRKILVVEDDPKTSATIRLYLEHEGFFALHASNGRKALEMIRDKAPDLVILDLMLPQVDGFHVCHAVRQFSEVPVIMLTARAGEDDKVQGLYLGADDYVTKPFSPRELVARVKTVLRRAGNGEKNRQFRSGDLVIDFTRHEVRLDDTIVVLTPTEFKLLETLARAPGRVFTRSELVERVRGSEFEGFDRTVDAHIMNLRKKIEPDRAQPRRVITVFGLGYKFSADSDVT
jgi:DNA-binding response OmpR family regulator